jgi:hypothetical protein
MRPDGGLPGHQAEQLGPSGQRHARITMLCWHHDPDHAQGRRHASRAASLGTSKVGAEIRSTRPMVREPLEVTLSGDLDPVIRKRLAEVVQSVQSYCRLAELDIAAVRPSIRLDPSLPSVGTPFDFRVLIFLQRRTVR